MDMFPEAPDFFGAENVEGWQGLDRVIKIRNRIVHPKVGADLTITDDGLNEVSEVDGWYEEVTESLFPEDLLS